jgi:phenylacetate-CoA ligase
VIASKPPIEPEVELSVIAPCLNEELNVGELTRRVLATFDHGEIAGELVLVDDGSTDGTAAAIRRLELEHPGRVRGAFSQHNRGIAAAWRLGLGASRGKLVSVIDADLQYQPEDLLRLRRELYDHSVDVVQGWRSPVGRARGQRYTLSRGLNVLLNRIFDMDMRDNKSGFIMCAREVMADLLSYKGSYFYWQSFIMVAADAKGYSYKEIETLFDERRAGQSFLEKQAITASAKSLFDLGKAAWEYRVRRPPPDVANQFLRRYPIVDRSPERNPLESLRWRAYFATYNQTHFMVTRDVEHYYETLRKTQWLTLAQMRELQDEKLRRMVRHAYRNVSYYRALMQARHLRPDDIRGQADLHRLPMLAKSDLRRHLCFDLLSDNHDKADVIRITTSGRDGEPLVCYADRQALELRAALALRGSEWTGCKFGEPSLRFWDEGLGAKPAQLAREQADAAFANRKLLSGFALDDAAVAEALAAIASSRPALIEGSTEVLGYLAERQLAAGGALPQHPRAVATSGQNLDQATRTRIADAFGTRVFDAYGCREMGSIGFECEAHAGYHVAAEGFIVEVLRDGRRAAPGESGEVVVTDLANSCMPWIRYRTGDTATFIGDEPCACGRHTPRFGDLSGRAPSILEGAGGRRVPGGFFAHYLKDFDYAIARFRVEQTGPGAVRFRFARAGRFSQEVLDEILATFRARLGEETRIDVEPLEGDAAGAAASPVTRAGNGHPRV